MSTCCKLRAVQSEQMASASWEVFFFTCSSWAAWITGSMVDTAPLWYRFFPLSHSSNWLMLYLKWHQWDGCYIHPTSWRYNKAMDLHGFDQMCTWAACQYSKSRYPCAAAGCWQSLHWGVEELANHLLADLRVQAVVRHDGVKLSQLPDQGL